ncbi:MAG: M48 family peptidase [Chloroflexi bacterium]|nr:MAG: M48 family peptidase [Chloroflexota bacterium]RLC86211.1 MAG: M48 family peptidase [Chloroflexota bacterium]
MSTQSVQYGTIRIEYELVYAPRKTLVITVDPNLRVLVKAPEGSPLADVEAKIHKRASWIIKQQRELERYLPHLPPRQYVSGETHRYLGRQYRLKVIEGASANGAGSVERDRSYIYVTTQNKTDKARIKRLLDDWYRAHAKVIFRERLDACYPKVEHLDVVYPDLIIRVLKSRWGSCSPKGRITLNVKLIQVPKSYIDYVIFHELCHLAEPNHSPRYYELLERVLPDWRERRERLNGFEFG